MAAVVLGAIGCQTAGEGGTIPPLPAAEGRVNPGLGEGTRPLSAGPGDKGSPSWGPAGDRVSYIVDGYVVDRPVDGGEVRRRTTRDFVAEEAEWTGDGVLTVLGSPGEARRGAGSLYRASSDEGSLAVQEIAKRILVFGRGSGEDRLVAALRADRQESSIALLNGGEVERVYTGPVEGTVTGLSLSPDGRKVVLAVRTAEDRRTFELRTFGLRRGDQRQVTRLDRGVEILGAPQWTESGLYFVAGSPAEDGEALYDLYRADTAPGEPEPVPGVGEDFVAGGIRVSPDGGRLAVVGRLNINSPANLYVLDLAAEDLGAVTTNEDMDIKTGPDDLAWSPAGTSVALVARSASTGEPQVRANPAEDLLDDFYNLYAVPVGEPPPGQIGDTP